MTKIGVHYNLSNEEYHGHKESISRSGLMDFNISPYHYWAHHLNPDRPIKETTPSMELGSAFHMMILEPELFSKTYVMLPPKVLLKDVGREEYELFKKHVETLEKSGLKVISANDSNILLSMKLVFFNNKTAMSLANDARYENSFLWQDKHSGLLLKARPDILHDNMIVDIKTCNDASPRAFQNSMASFGNHIQGAMIRDAVEELEGNRIDIVINILIETKYPHAMGIYFIDEFALDEGQVKYKQLCLDLKVCKEKDEWNDYGISTIGLPKWAS